MGRKSGTPTVLEHDVDPALGVDACPHSVTPSWTYSLHAADGYWLYVGIAYDLGRRLAQHRATKSWWPDVAIVIASLHCCRLHAADDEAWAISAHRELLNIARPTPTTPRPSRTARAGVTAVLHNGQWVSLR